MWHTGPSRWGRGHTHPTRTTASVALPGDRSAPKAWIYDIEVNPEHQGKGYGRALLHAAEQQAAQHGSKAIGLNVFGTNTVARRLYESSGDQITSMNMRKELGAA